MKNSKLKKVVLSIVTVVTVKVLLLSFAFIAYGQQRNLLEQLGTELDHERFSNVLLTEDRNRLLLELHELREQYDRLRGEKEAWERNGAGDGAPVPNPGGSGPTAYITIDDGPSKNTLAILEILAAYRVPATFFVTGNNYSGEAGIYRRIVSGGHVLGNHTYTHNFDRIYRSVDDFMSDFLRLDKLIYHETGVRTEIMRFPGGTSSATAPKVAGYDIMADLISAVIDRGYDYFDWNISSGDGNSATPAADLVKNVREQVERRGGDIVVLLHDGKNNMPTVEALPEILDFLQLRGYSFATLGKGVINVKHR
jgi:peptidoglycan-N-acetylglucosamine deacetylase